MKLIGIASAVALAIVAAAPAAAQSGEDLMKKHGCTACHQIDKKVVGPAYQDVAAKYKGDPKAATTLFESVKKGSTGKWGPVPMPPQPAPDADVKTIIGYILGLKK